jgi:hypothetical protein
MSQWAFGELRRMLENHTPCKRHKKAKKGTGIFFQKTKKAACPLFGILSLTIKKRGFTAFQIYFVHNV